MKRIPKPSMDILEVYESCINGVTDAATAKNLRSITKEISQYAQEYDDRARRNQLHLFSEVGWGNDAKIIVGLVSKGNLTSLYTNNMAKRSQPARSYYDRLLLLAPLGKCPYCGFGHVSTIDHFLSKARYPYLSVLPINLVPSCSDCNHGKGSGIVDEYNQIPHPYYEGQSIEIDEWLYASVIQTIPPSVEYFISTPEKWPNDLSIRLKNYFEDFELKSRFAVEAASEMVSLSDYLVLLASEDLIKIHLTQIAKIEREKRKNSWKSALYDALANSLWYCKQGWQM